MMSRPPGGGRRPSTSLPPSTLRTLLVAGLYLMSIWLTAGAVTWRLYDSNIADWKKTTRSTGISTAAYTQQAFKGADLVLKSMLDWIADEEIVTPEQFGGVMSERRFYEVLRDRIVGVPQISIAAIVAANGNVITNTFGYPAPSVNIASREPFERQMAPNAPDVLLSGLLRSSSSDRWMFYLSRRVTSKSGAVLGLVAVGLDAEKFSEMFRRLSVEAEGSISLFKTNGALLVTTLNGPQFNGKRYPDAFAVKNLREGSPGNVEITTVPMWSDPANKRARIIGYQRVEDFPAVVSVSVNSDVYLAEWRSTAYLTAGIALVLTALTVFIASRFVDHGIRTERADRVAGERRLLATLLDMPSALCSILDERGRVLYCNERFKAIVAPNDNPEAGLSNPSLRGVETLRSFLATSSEPSTELDLRIEAEGSATRFLRFSVSRQTLPDLGQCTILVGHDETERHRVQQAMAHSAKLVTLGEMTTGMAHELSQPLNVMRMAALNALSEIPAAQGGAAEADELSPMPDPEFRAFVAGKLNRIVGQVDRAAEIISRMRIFGRASEGPPSRFDARGACRDAVALTSPRLRSMGITVRLSVGDEPLPLVGYENLLEQVIVNLLLNARDALKDVPNADKIVSVVGERVEGVIRIRVADNGPGVPMAIRDRIFEPFFTAKPMGQGTGLGLALSFGIVRDMGGTLLLLPTAVGATFEIEFPAIEPKGEA